MAKNDLPIIKIMVSHRTDFDSKFIDDPVFVNIRCGAVFDKRKNIEMIGDDTGDNISHKKESHSELTVQYWAWKNIKADYYGLFHYRRYLSFSDETFEEDEWGHVLLQSINNDVIKKYGLDSESISKQVVGNDLIVSKVRFKQNIRDQFSLWHDVRYFDLMLKIIEEKFPDYYEDAKYYANQNEFIPCDIFIMSKELFFEYCSWFYSIMDTFESRYENNDSNSISVRTPGYVGERLLGIFYNHLKRIGSYKIKILQMIMFIDNKEQKLPKPVNDESIPIVISTDHKFSLFAASTIQSIVSNSNNSNTYEIIIMSKDITEEDKSIINSVCNCPNFAVQYYFVNEICAEFTFNSFCHISEATYYRLLIQYVMSHYKKIIYLDCDVVVCRDLKELYDADLKDNIIGGVIDPEMVATSYLNPEMMDYANKSLNIDEITQYINCGVLVIDIKKMASQFEDFELATVASKNKFRWGDQDVINKYCNGKIQYLDNRWNVMCDCNGRLNRISTYAPIKLSRKYFESRLDPFIVHYAGHIKPWNNPKMDLAHYFWNEIRGSRINELVLYNLVGNESAKNTELRNAELKNAELKNAELKNAELKNAVLTLQNEINQIKRMKEIENSKKMNYANIKKLFKFIIQEKLCPVGTKRRMLLSEIYTKAAKDFKYFGL